MATPPPPVTPVTRNLPLCYLRAQVQAQLRPMLAAREQAARAAAGRQ